MKETWSAMRKIIAPIMFVALATTGLSVAGATAAKADTSTITWDGSTYDSLSSAYGCDWWTSANNAKADGSSSTGNALQCSHPGTAGVRLTATSGMTFTSSAASSVSFNIFSLDNPTTVKVRIVAEGVAAPEATLNIPAGWSSQTVDFSSVTGYNASASYTRLDIEASDAGSFWVDNLNLLIDAPPAAPETSGAKTITWDGSTYDSLASAYGCDWWTSANNAKADGSSSTGNALQCSHPGTAGVRLTGTGGKSFTTSGSASVSFNIFSLDNPTTVKVRIVAEGVAAPEATLSIPAGWSSQTVDFSSVTGYNASASYTRLDIEASDAGSFWVDNLGFYLNVTGASASASASASPVPTVGSIKLDSADLGPVGVYGVGNGWWSEGNGSISVVKYIDAGSTLALHYTVKDTAGNPVSGAQVTLATSGGADSAMSGDRTKSTDADGKVTFTFVSSTSNADAENRRTNMNAWSDPDTGEVKFDAIPYISGSSRTTGCYDAAPGCNRDRLWGHVVSTQAPVSNASKTTIRLVLNDKSGMTDKSGWWTDNANNRSMVKMVTAGNKLVLHYQVAVGGTPVGSGKTVTLAKTIVNDGFDYTGSLSANTDSQGIATFVLTNVNTSGENRPVSPSTMNYWDDSRNQGSNSEVQFSPSVSPLTTAIVNYDRVWTHIVNKPSTQGVPAAPYLVTAKRSGSKQITVNWNAATEDGNSNTGYEVTLSRTGGPSVVATAAPSATSLAVNVSVVAAYTASVKAINSAGKSAGTAASGAVTPGSSAPKAPNAPVMGTSPTKGIDALWLPFSPNTADSGATASGFQYSLDNGVNWKDATFDTANYDSDPVLKAQRTGNVLFLYGLTTGTSYSVMMRAINSVGVGAASTAKVTATATAPTKAPTLSTVSLVGSKLTIGFAGIPVASNGGTPITGYWYSVNGGSTWVKVTSSQLTAGKIEVTPGTAAPYTVTMRAFNGAYSPNATAKSVTTIGTAPTFTVTAGTGKVVLSITALTASQNTSNSPVTKYQYTKDNGVTWIDTAAGLTNITAAKGTTVSVKVRAVNSVGAGTASTAKSAAAR